MQNILNSISHFSLKGNLNFSLITWKQNLWWLLICNDIYARFKASFWIRKLSTFECTSVHIISLLLCLFMFFKNKVSHGRSTFKKLDLALSITNPISILWWEDKTPNYVKMYYSVTPKQRLVPKRHWQLLVVPKLCLQGEGVVMDHPV